MDRQSNFFMAGYLEQADFVTGTLTPGHGLCSIQHIISLVSCIPGSLLNMIPPCNLMTAIGSTLKDTNFMKDCQTE